MLGLKQAGLRHYFNAISKTHRSLQYFQIWCHCSMQIKLFAIHRTFSVYFTEMYGGISARKSIHHHWRDLKIKCLLASCHISQVLELKKIS
jgi:hypothetical protein